MNETAPETALRATLTGEQHLNDEFRRSMLRRGVEPQQIPDLDDWFFAALRDAGWVDPEEAARLRADYWRAREDRSQFMGERDALLPVVEAAKAWRKVYAGTAKNVAINALAAAVDALDSGSGTEAGDG